MSAPEILSSEIRRAALALLAKDPTYLRTHVILRAPARVEWVPDDTALGIAADYGVSDDAIEQARERLTVRSDLTMVFVDLDHGTVDVWEQPIPRR